MSLTVHFFDGKQLKYFVLNSNEFPERKKTAENITDWFEERVEELIGFDMDYILVTDSARNLVCAFKNTEKRISCVAHTINLAVKHVFSEIKCDAKKSREAETATSDFDLETSDEEDSGLDISRWKQRTNDNLKSAEVCADILSQSQRISTYMNHSKPDELTHTVKNICETRWNTHLTMFRSIADLFDTISQIVKENPSLKLSFDFSQLKAFVDFLIPFETATLNLSMSQEPTLHLVIPWLVKFDKLCQSSSSDIRFVSYLKNLMIEAIDVKIMPKLERVYFAAALLDSRFKKNDFIFERRKYPSCKFSTKDEKDYLKEKYYRFENTAVENHMEEIDFFTEGCHKEPAQDDEWNAYFSTNDYHSDYYIKKLGEDIPFFQAFKFWDAYKIRYPRLYKLAFWLLSVPATSVASEKNFSDSKWMINCRRTNLNPENVNNSLVVKSFLKY